MKVLLADDDRDQLTVRSMLLARSGFETLEATDRNAAVEIAAAEKPQCAVIDLRFPTEEIGLRLIRELKGIDSNMHVFVLTGGDPERFARRPERKLVDQVIIKGSAASRLLQELRSLAASEAVPDAKFLRGVLQQEGTVVFNLKVIPRAAKNEIVGMGMDGALKAKVTAVPEKGRANEELCVLLASYFGVGRRGVEILSGENSQHKRVRVSRLITA